MAPPKRVVEIAWDDQRAAKVCQHCRGPVTTLRIPTQAGDARAHLCGCGLGESFHEFYATLPTPREPLPTYLLQL